MESALIIAVSLGGSLILGKIIIPLLQVLKFGQIVRDDGPGSHLKKKGTPTMGGVIFLLPALLISGFMVYRGSNGAYYLVVLLFTAGFGFVGLADDALKVVLRRPLGLRAREKLLWQLIITVAASLVLVNIGHSTELVLPFIGFSLDLKFLYWPFLLFLAIGFGNAVNITDGVDGLASSVMGASCLSYLVISQVAQVGEVYIFALTLLGGLLGFLFYNRHPARVFMGDVGSLALGGALTAMAVLTKTELLLVIVGMVFVLEALSVIIQVVYFRLTGGKRFFRMAPLHHHLELGGWSEYKIVGVLLGLSVLFGLIGLLGLANMGR